MSARRAFFVNSALGFASAELITSALHEAGHGLAAQALGFSPRIYAFYEDNPTGSPVQNLIILAAGPLTSLVLGALFLIALRMGKARYTFARLLLFWLAWMGITLFVNYVIVTPWLSAGDTAAIADILRVPLWGRYAISLIGIAAIAMLARPVRATMLAVAPQVLLPVTPAEGRRLVIRGFYLPLVVGVALVAVAGIGGNPVIVMLGLLGTFGSIDFVVAALYANVTPQASRNQDAPLRIEPAALGLYLAMTAVYVLVFTRGMPV